MTWAIADAANLALKLSHRVEHLHSAVHRIGYQHRAIRADGDVRGEIEFAGAGAAFAEFAHEIAAQVERGNAVLLSIGHKKTILPDRQARRARNTFLDLKEKSSVEVKRQ